MTRVPAATARRLSGEPLPKGSDGERTLEAQFRLVGGPVPEREYRFDPSRLWRFDFAWPDLLVACEVEGGTWSAGRHVRGSGFAADITKYNEAAIRGWTVIRVTTDMVDDGRAVQLVGRALWIRGQER